ncbi:NADP-dependent oxidoreductase domain-containing protein [Elsinoe ampelina]|uniref:NADP-dependent oxidoreductase domain-containing protein n=1 Tax=Elsinoe ampelina TaxID=302913 RepID=A0A6A6G1Q2_9PEZI|nr:NADP-dependent oxidoreductase domain-containing protein [Elsinoe ampelina]
MSANGVKVVLGGSMISDWSSEVKEEYVRIIKENELWDVDTSIIYPQSEAVLGKLQGTLPIRVHTKTPGFKKGLLKRDIIFEAARESQSNVPDIDLYFLQTPDPDTPMEEYVGAVADLHKEGMFKRFRLSNFSAEETQQVYDLCKKNGWILPTVYSGQYSAIARISEEDLFPVLRKLKISFWVYWPLAAGFLAKPFESFNLPGSEGFGPGRFAQSNFFGGMFNSIFNKPKLLEGLKLWGEVAKDEGITPAELAYRWLHYHSILEEGDAVIVGSSRPEQLESTLSGIAKGPLKATSVDKIEQVWKIARDDAPDCKPQYLSF